MSDSRTPESPEALAGSEAYARGDFERAASLFAGALNGSTDAGERLTLLLRLANAHDELCEYTQALDALRRALEIDDGDTAVWNNIGVICLKIGRIDEAREALERAVTLHPSNVAALISLGSVALKQGDPGNAKHYLDLALEEAPGHPLAHANMSLTLAVFGRTEEAEDELRLAALYGFSDAGTIQSRIDRLKAIRDSILEKYRADADAGLQADDEGEEYIDEGEAPVDESDPGGTEPA